MKVRQVKPYGWDRGKSRSKVESLFGMSTVICGGKTALFLFLAVEQRSYGEKVLAALEAEARIFVNVRRTTTIEPAA